MRNKRNEISYYEEIKTFIKEQLTSNFYVKTKKNLHVFWGIGELKSNLCQIINENSDVCACVKPFVKNLVPLNLDIFALITNGEKFDLLILEIKMMDSVGLKEWSQLVGYCMVSGAKYGLLINIDNGASQRLQEILTMEQHLSNIKTIVNNRCHEKFLGFMQWDSVTHDVYYSNLGAITSLSGLSSSLLADFYS